MPTRFPQRGHRRARAAGFGAGVWNRRRRHGRIVPPGDDIGSRDGTWLSLSLDEDGAVREGPGEVVSGIGPRPAPTATPAPPQPPPPGSSGGDHAAPTLGSTADSELTARAVSGDEVVLADGPGDDGASISVGTSSDPQDTSSQSLDSADSDAGLDDATPLPALLEEDTEAVDVPVPAAIECTLADEVLPWPPMLVTPTLVLPGAWPPPPGALGRTQPSLVSPTVEPSPGPAEELSLAGLTGGDPVGGESVEVSIDEEISITDMDIGSLVSSDAPPVRGTLDDMPVVVRGVPTAPPSVAELSPPPPERPPPAEPGGRPQASPRPAVRPLDASSEDDDVPTEVSERDALEEALAVLRTSEPGAGFQAARPAPSAPSAPASARGASPPLALLGPDGPGEAPFETHSTADELISLELIDEDEGPVDPAVRSDMDLAPVKPPQPPAWLALGSPSFSVFPALASQPRAWIALTMEVEDSGPPGAAPDRGSDPPSTTERTTDLRELARRRAIDEATHDGDPRPVEETLMDPSTTGDGDDWLSDVEDDDLG